MDNKKEPKEEVLKVKVLENRLKEIDKDLSNGYSIGKKLARNKIQEKLNYEESNIFFL
ncbi:MAG: hypothetical protein E7B53_14245 [Clostridium sp.]|uniref:hypothetical protein n=1 Tax=Clostridium sp. TaxID=1506 RepID=UPI0029011D6A|nr:hypothetical protein [Clostridium sp.]MDU2895699.1 hypothetical protein [Clostridium sp.]MDU3008091.1 hypothetical protein [Clostridium sp.]MDU3037960.1 hypothetical protein [Clostridium sp.]MDU3052924.1 hypothetical protein [Clostridium sp.]